jgi:hypothetical protein
LRSERRKMKRKKRGFIICGVDVEWDGNKIGIKKERKRKERKEGLLGLEKENDKREHRRF